MIEPLTITLELDCSVEHVFRVHTQHASRWFPVKHTMAGVPGLAVIFVPHEGGRSPERMPDGAEADWGTITA